MQVSGLPRLQIQLNKNATNTTTGVENLLQLIVNGTEIDISLIEENGNSTQALSGITEDILFRRSNTSVLVLFPLGVAISASAANVCTMHSTQ